MKSPEHSAPQLKCDNPCPDCPTLSRLYIKQTVDESRLLILANEMWRAAKARDGARRAENLAHNPGMVNSWLKAFDYSGMMMPVLSSAALAQRVESIDGRIAALFEGIYDTQEEMRAAAEGCAGPKRRTIGRITLLACTSSQTPPLRRFGMRYNSK